MNPGRVCRAAGKALLYFLVYFVCQILVVNWVSIAAAFVMTLTADPTQFLPEGIADITALTAEQYQLYSEKLSLWVVEEMESFIARWAMPLTLASGIFTLAMLTLIFRIRKKRLLTEAGLTAVKPASLIPAFTLGVSLNLFVSLLMNLIPFPQSWMDDYLESSSVIDGGSLIAWITAVIAAPIVEEIVFRGLCYTRLKKGMPMLAAMLISAWGFGIVHGTIIWFLYASLFGFVLAWLYEKYQSLAACIVMHFSFNLTGQLSSLTTEISDAAFWLMMVSGAIVSAALILHIQRTSPHKIELTMPVDPAERNL